MQYDKGLVAQVSAAYKDYMIANWKAGKTGVMAKRRYEALKKEAFRHALAQIGQANFPYREWQLLVAKHGVARAHRAVANPSQETGRRMWINLSALTQNDILNKGGRTVMRSNGKLMGRKGINDAPNDQPQLAVKTAEPAARVATAQTMPQNDLLRWRLLDCAIHGGVLPSSIALSKLLAIEVSKVDELLEWLERITIVEGRADGGYSVKPRPIDARKVLEVFTNQERNPFEYRALDVLLGVLAE